MAFVTYKESIDSLLGSLESNYFYEKVFLDDALGHTLAEDIVA
ncbi:MAG: molybdopterin molybdenumtransferase MoeA, partial [Sulfurospirillum sp.]